MAAKVTKILECWAAQKAEAARAATSLDDSWKISINIKMGCHHKGSG